MAKASILETLAQLSTIMDEDKAEEACRLIFGSLSSAAFDKARADELAEKFGSLGEAAAIVYGSLVYNPYATDRVRDAGPLQQSEWLDRECVQRTLTRFQVCAAKIRFILASVKENGIPEGCKILGATRISVGGNVTTTGNSPRAGTNLTASDIEKMEEALEGVDNQIHLRRALLSGIRDGHHGGWIDATEAVEENTDEEENTDDE